MTILKRQIERDRKKKKIESRNIIFKISLIFEDNKMIVM